MYNYNYNTGGVELKVLALLVLIISSTTWARDEILDVNVRPQAVVMWLPSASSTMSQGSERFVAATEDTAYIGVITNSVSGYSLIITANKALPADAKPVLKAVNGLLAGAEAVCHADLSGSSSSADVSFSNSQALPLSAGAPNVFMLSGCSVPCTATVVLK